MSIVVDLSRRPIQTRAMQALRPGNRVCNAWGRGYGKSTFLRLCAYLLVAEWERKVRPGADRPGVRIVILMPTLVQFKKVHAAGLRAELGDRSTWAALGGRLNRTDWRVDFPGGSWIQVVSAEAGNGAAGIRCDVVFVDEADDVEIDFYEAIVAPWFSEPHSLKMRLITGTPRRGRFGLLWRAFRVWPYGDAEHPKVPNAFSFHATYLDSVDIDHGAVEIEKLATSPERFAREWMCDFDAGEGLVYPFFDPAFHVRPPPNMSQFHSFVVGVDYGFNDPSVFLVIGIAGKGRDTISHVVHERYMLGKSATELAQAAREIESAFPGARWYADHSPTLNKTLKDDAGVDIHEATKGAGSVEDGVAFVADAIFIRTTSDGYRWTQLYVDPSCVYTVSEMGLYRRKRDPRNKERILDDIDSSKNDHCMDALRYALHTHFGGTNRSLYT